MVNGSIGVACAFLRIPFREEFDPTTPMGLAPAVSIRSCVRILRISGAPAPPFFPRVSSPASATIIVSEESGTLAIIIAAY